MKCYGALMILLPACIFALLYTRYSHASGQSNRIPRNTSIVGRVTDDFGGPASAEVIVYARPISNGHMTLKASCSAKTDADGKYECHSLKEEHYVIAVHPIVPASTDTPIGTPLLPTTYYPNCGSLDEAETLTLHDGQTQVADISIAPARRSRIVGRLPEHAEQPVIKIFAHSSNYDLEQEIAVHYKSDSGDFDFPAVPVGTYLITAEWNVESIQRHLEALVTVTENHLSRVQLTDVHRPEVFGDVALAEDDVLRPTPLPTQITVDGIGDRTGWSFAAQIDTNGRFRFPPMGKGRYVVHTNDGDANYVSGIAVDGKSREGGDLEIFGNRTSIIVHLKLRVTHATISGHVDLNDHAQDKAGVSLVQEPAGRVTAVSLNKSGQFTFANVPPGRYRIYAWSDLGRVAYRDPNVLDMNRKLSLIYSIDADSMSSTAEPELIDPQN